MNKVEIGKEFEKRAFIFLKSRFDKVEWLSKENPFSSVDFECYKKGKRFMIECKANLYGCRKDKDDIDFFVTLLKGKIKLIPYSEVKDSGFRTISISLRKDQIDWAKKRYRHYVYFIEKMFKREMKKDKIREMIKKEGKKK